MYVCVCYLYVYVHICFGVHMFSGALHTGVHVQRPEVNIRSLYHIYIYIYIYIYMYISHHIYMIYVRER